MKRYEEEIDYILNQSLCDFVSREAEDLLKIELCHNVKDFVVLSESSFKKLASQNRYVMNKARERLKMFGLDIRPDDILAKDWLKKVKRMVISSNHIETIDENYSPEKAEYFDKLLQSPVADLGFSRNALAALRRAGVRIVEDLIMFRKNKLKLTRRLGQLTLNEIVETLAEYGLRLRPQEVYYEETWYRQLKKEFNMGNVRLLGDEGKAV